MALYTLIIAAIAASAHAEFNIRRIEPFNKVAIPTRVLPKAQHSVALTRKVPRSTHKKDILKTLRHGSGAKSSTSNFTAVVAGSDDDEEYLTDITIGGQNFSVIVDTGSSDTWLAQKGFKCFNLLGKSEPVSECAFGTAGFDATKSSTYTPDPNKNFNISYGDGEFLTGVVGFDTVTVGGLTVTKQEIGLVTNAAWEGDGVNTGLMGLAFSGLTSVYDGTNPDDDSSSNVAEYNPLFFTAIAEGAVAEPYFSVALNRGSVANEEDSSVDPNLGYLAFGGIAPVKTTSTAVTVPIQGYSVSSGSSEFLWYTVDVDAYTFTGSTKLSGSGKQAILDTGTTLNYIPTTLAKAFNAKFSPPATFKEDEDTYYVDCDATAPSFKVKIGGVSFSVDGADNILPAGTDDKGNEVCISGTQDGGSSSDADNIFILGDTFLHNVVATFNVKTNEITLTERAAY